jgi:hypothetical protein
LLLTAFDSSTPDYTIRGSRVKAFVGLLQGFRAAERVATFVGGEFALKVLLTSFRNFAPILGIGALMTSPIAASVRFRSICSSRAAEVGPRLGVYAAYRGFVPGAARAGGEAIDFAQDVAGFGAKVGGH